MVKCRVYIAIEGGWFIKEDYITILLKYVPRQGEYIFLQDVYTYAICDKIVNSRFKAEYYKYFPEVCKQYEKDENDEFELKKENIWDNIFCATLIKKVIHEQNSDHLKLVIDNPNLKYNDQDTE